MKNLKHFKLYFLMIVLGLVIFTGSFLYSNDIIVFADNNSGSFEYSSNSSLSTNNSNDNYSTQEPAGEYKRMHITLDVNENGVIAVEYDFDAMVFVGGISEIVLYVPYRDNIYREENDKFTETSYVATIKNAKLSGNTNEKLNIYYDEIPGYVTFGVKSPTFYEKNEKKSFKVSFDYNMRNKGLDDFDEVYFNLLSVSNVDINNVTFQMDLPKDVDFVKYQPHIYLGAVATSNEITDFKIVNNSIVSTKAFTVKGSDSTGSPEALTFRQLLPKGYLNIEISNRVMPTIVLVVAIGLSLIVLILKIKNKHYKLIVPVQLEMPEMLPSEAEAIYKRKVTKKSLGATIIYLASKGYLCIETEGENNEPQRLRKLKDLPPKAEHYLKKAFDSLFKNGDVVDIEAFDNSTMYSNIVNHKCNVEDRIKENYYTESSKKLSIISKVLSIVSIIIVSILTMFIFREVVDNLFMPNDAMNILATLFILVIFEVFRIVLTKNKSSWVLMTVLGIVFGIPLSIAFVVCLMSVAPYGGLVRVIISYILVLIMYYLPTLKKYTPETEKKVSTLIGVRNYINKVEKLQLELLVSQNPNIYFDILPFAYVLGVSDKWINAFEDINIECPDWIVGVGYVPMLRVRSFSNVCNRLGNRTAGYMSHQRLQNTIRNSRNSWSGRSGGSSRGGSSGGGFSGGGGGGASFGFR